MFRKILTAAAVAIGTVALPAQAATAIDQSQMQFNMGMPFGYGSEFGTVFNVPVGQSYTAGVSRTLASVSIYCNGICTIDELGNTLTMEVHAGAGLGGALLGTATQSGDGVLDTTIGFRELRFDFASFGILQTAGAVYSFAVTSITGPGDIGTRGILQHTGDPYAGGSVTASPFYGEQPGWDLMFNTRVAAIPEPASWALMIVGFGMIGATIRRRAALAA